MTDGARSEPTGKGRQRRRVTWIALCGFVLAALLLTSRLWWAGRHVSLAGPGRQDQNLFEWFFAHAAWSVTHLQNPLVADRLNVPDKVNVLANTSMLGLGVLFTPVTLLFGAHLTFALVLIMGLAGTAFAWFRLLSNTSILSPWAAACGAAVCGFGPGMVSHAGAHPNFVAQFMVPVILARVMALCGPGNLLRNGALLAAAIVAQFFIGEEVLFITAVSCAVFFGTYAFVHRDTVRPLVPRCVAGLGIAAAFSAAALAYPVYVQFFGPASYRGIFESSNNAGSDLMAVVAHSSASLGGDVGRVHALFTNVVEENTFYSWPFLVLVSFGTAWCWSDRRVRVVGITAIVLIVMSLGPHLRFRGEQTEIPLPMSLIVNLPIFRVAIPARFGLAGLSALGVLVAFVVDAALREPPAVRRGWLAAIATALIPLLPTPLSVSPRERTPAFFTKQAWAPYVEPGQSVVPVPLPNWDTDDMHWAAEAQLGYTLPRGYFHGPGGADRSSVITPPHRYLSALLDGVKYTRQVPTLSPENREAAMADLAYWNAGVVALVPNPAEKELREVLVDLLGEPVAAHGVLLWDLPVHPRL